MPYDGHQEYNLNLKQAVSKTTAEFEKSGYDVTKLDEIMNKIDYGHVFIKTLFSDLNQYDGLKKDPKFLNNISEDGRGWLARHSFPITLEIMNKERLPGKDVYISALGEERPLLIYYGLCPELENFMTLIVWTSSKSSMNVWNKILDLLEKKEENKVLLFSPKCGIHLPNEIHPARDFDAKLVSNEYFESLYDWKYNPFLFDDGLSILAHNSPINYRKIFLDEYTHEEAFVGIRTTIGRVLKVFPNKLVVLVPMLHGKPRIIEFIISKQDVDWKSIKLGSLYFLSVFKMTGLERIETHVRKMEEATACDILGMFLTYACYLSYLNKSCLRISDTKQFEELFIELYEQVSRFCHKDKHEMETIENINWKTIQPGYTSTITRWIGEFLFYIPPILRQQFSEIDTKNRDFLVLEFDKALRDNKSKCFEKIPFNDKENRRFSLSTMGKYNSLYSFIRFLLENKKFILGIKTNWRMHEREKQFGWLNNFLVDEISR